MVTTLDRAKVLAYRAWAQGLHGGVEVPDLDLLTVGLQDTPAGSAALSLRHRSPGASITGPELVLAMTVRGAPHLHRRGALPMLRAALRPHDNDTMSASLSGFGAELVAAGEDGPKLLDKVVAELRASFPGETATKGELSGAVSARLPTVLTPWCAGCGVAHIPDGMLRLGVLFSGIELVAQEGRRQLFRMPAEEPKVEGDGRVAMVELSRQYVRFAGPVGLGDLAAWLETRPVTTPPDWIRPLWTDLVGELVPVRVDGKELFADAETVDMMRDPPPPPPAMLLPPRDPYLLGDRSFVAPDRAIAKAVWRPLGSPGAVVVDGEIAGTWRARRSGRKLQLVVTAHRILSSARRKAVETAGEQVAAARGVESGRTTLTWEE